MSFKPLRFNKSSPKKVHFQCCLRIRNDTNCLFFLLIRPMHFTFGFIATEVSVNVYFSNHFLLRTFQINCSTVPNYYSQRYQFFPILRKRRLIPTPSLISYSTSIINHVNISYQGEICWSINSTSAVFRVLASRRDTFNL